MLTWLPSCLLIWWPPCWLTLDAFLFVWRHCFVNIRRLGLDAFFVFQHWSPSCLFKLVAILFVFIRSYFICKHRSPFCLFILDAVFFTFNIFIFLGIKLKNIYLLFYNFEPFWCMYILKCFFRSTFSFVPINLSILTEGDVGHRSGRAEKMSEHF